MKAYIGAMYLDARKYDLLAFWKQVCEDRSVRDLMLKYYPGDKEGGDERREEEDPDEPGTSSGASHRLGQVRRKALEDLSSATVAKERLVLPASRERTTEEDLFSVGAHLGTRDLAGQRVLQIATIVRNLSFEEDNSTVLACNQSLLRFVLNICVFDAVLFYAVLPVFQVLSAVLQLSVEQLKPDGIRYSEQRSVRSCPPGRGRVLHYGRYAIHPGQQHGFQGQISSKTVSILL